MAANGMPEYRQNASKTKEFRYFSTKLTKYMCNKQGTGIFKGLNS
jgi:hypothetical protein